MRAWIRLPSPAMGVALIALVVALSGTTYAAVRIGTKQIKNNAITSVKIRNGQVRNVDLARNSVVTAKILAGAVTGLQIRDASVGNADLANDSVSGAKMRGGAVGNSDLANDAVTAAKIRAGNVGNSELADGRRDGGEDQRRLRGRRRHGRRHDHGEQDQGRRGREGQRPHALDRAHAAGRRRPDDDPERARPRCAARELRGRHDDDAVAEHHGGCRDGRRPAHLPSRHRP